MEIQLDKVLRRPRRLKISLFRRGERTGKIKLPSPAPVLKIFTNTMMARTTLQLVLPSLSVITQTKMIHLFGFQEPKITQECITLPTLLSKTTKATIPA